MTFLKTFWASFFAVIISLIAVIVLLSMSFAGLFSAFESSSKVSVSSGTVIKIDFEDAIVDSPEFSAINSVDFATMKINSTLTLLDVISALEFAMRDDKVDGVYLDFSKSMNLDWAKVEELRAALLKFKVSGKFVVSYGDSYSQGDVFLSSVSDKVFLNPQGELSWMGLVANQLFFKGALDKMGIEPVILRSGSYKSAIEPFTRESMSEQNREQSQRMVESMWQTVKEDISTSRGIAEDKLQLYADKLQVVFPEDAVALGFVDSLSYYDGVLDHIKKLQGGDKVKFISLAKYSSSSKQRRSLSENKIALLYMDGEIVDGKSEQGTVGSETIVKKLRSLREDEDVKALVLRVNSPGGSALASEVIWREVALTREQMPVVVSMGSVAASGGYYVSVPADVILSDKLTITGSIGVFSMMFTAKDALEDKLGITSDVVKSATSADMGSVLRSPTRAEIAYGEKQVDRVYQTFLQRVSQGRDISLEKLADLAEGRVFTGMDALKCGLVDGVGGLSQAILLAEQKAELYGDFKVWEVLENKSSLTDLLSALQGSYVRANLGSELGQGFVHYQRLQNIIKQRGVSAITPYIYDIQ